MSWIHSIRAAYWTVPNSGLRYAMLRECKNRISEYRGQYTLAAVSQRTTIMVSTIKKLESGEMQIHDKLIESLIADLQITKEEFFTMSKPVETALQAEVLSAPVAMTPAPAVVGTATATSTAMSAALNESYGAAPAKRKRRTKAEMEAARATSTAGVMTPTTTPSTTTPSTTTPSTTSAPTPSQIKKSILDTVPVPAPDKKSESVFTFVNHTSDAFFIRVEGNTIHILEMVAANRTKGTFVPGADDMAGTFIARTTLVSRSK